MDKQYEYYRVKVERDKETNRLLIIEWFDDPEPRDDLVLHREFGPARSVFHSKTGEHLYDEDYVDGVRLARIVVSPDKPSLEPDG